MSSETQGYQGEEGLGNKARPELSPEEKVLHAILGMSPSTPESIRIRVGSGKDLWVTDLDTAATPTRLTSSCANETTVLIGHWIEHHLPTAQIEQISALATAVIGDKGQATKWLSDPNLALDNRPPIDLIGEKDGYERVQSLLLRIEHGDLA